MTHLTHETLPSGFCYADRLQVEAFMATGSVDGASKVALVAGPGELPRLAVRLRPPYRFEAIKSHSKYAVPMSITKPHTGDTSKMWLAATQWYIAEYKAGFKAGRDQAALDTEQSPAWRDGFFDRASGRAKWHRAYCADHGKCGA